MNEFLINLLNGKLINEKIYNEKDELIDNPIFKEVLSDNRKISYNVKEACKVFNINIGSNIKNIDDFELDENKSIKCIHLVNENNHYVIPKTFKFQFLLEILYIIAKHNIDYKKEIDCNFLNIEFDKIVKKISNETFSICFNALEKYNLIELNSNKTKFIFSYYIINLFENKKDEIINKNFY